MNINPRTRFVLFCLILLLFTQCERNNDKKETGDEPLKEVTKQEIINQSVKCLIVDDIGNKWLGTDSALYMYDNSSWYKFVASNISHVNSLAMRDGLILVATDSGAYSLSPVKASTSVVDTLSFNQPGGTFQQENVFNTGMGQRNWFGTPAGLSMYDGNKWMQNKIISNNLVSISNVHSMAFRKNDAFFGTYGSYLYHVKYNPQTDAITGASQMLGGADNPHSNYNGELTTDTIFCVFAAADSSIWFGSVKGLTRNKGATKVDNGLFEYSLRGERVHCVYEFSNKTIWAGTENGVFVLQNGTWTNYNISTGLAGKTVLCMAEDKDGIVWIGTTKGLLYYKSGAIKVP